MSFVSVAFLVFLPAVFALHWVGRSRRWQNAVLILASYVFYGWWDWRFCFLMLGVSMVDYVAGTRLGQCSDPRRRRRILMTAVGAHLVVLSSFKYFHFFADSLAVALAPLGWDLGSPTFNVILPVGISFYTFQTMSYTLDVYRGTFPPRRNLLDYLAFVSFFPQLVAGPIERASALLPQFETARTFGLAEAREGCRFMLWGFVKKMLLADNLAPFVNQAYGTPGSASAATLALATVLFAFQIYCDFSAYSDIAVGVARWFGIRLSRNFAYPYFSQSLSEFWRRWHISLSTWFRDYVFIPLGGSRGSLGQTVRNLCATTLISGLWHGAAWHFIGWGGFHGLGLSGGRLVTTLRKPARGVAAGDGASASSRTAAGSAGSAALPTPGGSGWFPSCKTTLRMLRTFALVCLGWVLFRADSFGEALGIYRTLLVGILAPSFYPELGRLVLEHAALVGALGAFVGVEWLSRKNWNTLAVGAFPVPVRWAIYTGLFWLCLTLGTEQTGNFIYFRF
jgi:D-alanyl-lipoteichoic acid acyltransferase DltB (MBOAT superfamily)